MFSFLFSSTGVMNRSLVCQAHAMGKRVIPITGFPPSTLTNKTAQQEWLSNLITTIQEHYYDG